MDEPTQGPGVFGVRNSAVELRLELMTALAAAVTTQQLRWQQALAALNALRYAYGFDRVQALRAYRKARNICQGNTAETAFRGKEDRKNTAYYGQHWRDEEGTPLGALYSSLAI
jgi:hypothetical protein